MSDITDAVAGVLIATAFFLVGTGNENRKGDGP
jgi:hypothetical protein